MRSYQLAHVARAASVLAVVVLLAVLASHLGAPGYHDARLYLFCLIGAVGLLGGVGAVFDRPTLIGSGGIGIFLLGFWQAVLGVFMLPVAAVLVTTAVLVYGVEEARAGGDSSGPGSAR